MATPGAETTHRIYMHFMLRQGWHIQFLEEDCKTPLARKLTFTDSDKIAELARRGGGLRVLEDKQSFERGLETGRGGLWLQLTEAQYQQLRRPSGSSHRALPPSKPFR